SVGNIEHITARLIEHGKRSETPVAVIEWGTTDKQRTIIGTLATISKQIEQEVIQNPAMILVGDVVNVREDIKWFIEKEHQTC
ncbi:MAG: uroporphyrin-III C-methyltransferase, partial [Solibacillus sp.]